MALDPVQLQIERVRRIALALPDTTEKLSHGEPTFFVGKRVFVMFANDHHHDGHIAIWIPVPPGAQLAMIADAPEVYFKPPYVGTKGWIGVELARCDEAALMHLIIGAFRLTGRKAINSLARSLSK